MISVDTSAVRLPNRVAKGLTIDPVSGTAKEKCLRDVIMSPTSFLNGSASPTIKSFATSTQENSVSFEGEMLRKEITSDKDTATYLMNLNDEIELIDTNFLNKMSKLLELL